MERRKNQTEIDFERNWSHQQEKRALRNVFVSLISLILIGVFGRVIVEQVSRLDANGTAALPLFCGSIVVLLIVVGVVLAASERVKNA